MKSLTFWVMLAATFLAVSCGRSGDRFGSHVFRIPWPGADGALSLQDVEIPTLSDPEHLKGSSARILVEPGDGGSTLAGTTPVGRYLRTSSGVMIPADYVTLQAVTTYAHQERLRAIDASVGAVTFLSWPLSVGIEVRLMTYGQVSKNNAVFDAKLNSLLLVPYDEGDLPIALNPGILAHEHFHFLFQTVVLSRVHDTTTQTSCRGGVAADFPTQVTRGEKSDFAQAFSGPNQARLEKTAREMSPKIYNAFVLRAMNEGFADFWGWLYSQDDSFLAKSLPDQDYLRRLDKDPGRLPTEALVRRLLVDNFHPDSVLPDAVRAHNAYSIGTIYARYLRHLADQLETSGVSRPEARLSVARALIASLPAIADVVEKTYDTGFVSPNLLLQPLISNLPSLTSAACESLESVRAPEEAFVRPKACDAWLPKTSLKKVEEKK